MGSLRNPIGPLPSSIYWRRRVVLVSVVAVLALLVTWIVTSGGGGGKKNADGSNGKNPASTITPGPSSSGPAISQHPGGRDESSGGDGSGGSDSGSGSGGSGSDDGDGSGSGDGSDTGGSGSGSGSGGTGSSGGGVGTSDTIPASSSLPDCAPGAVTLSLRSVHNSYSPDQTPTFELVVKNTGSSACKTDLGPRNAVLTITPADGDNPFWSSDDCPKGATSLVFKVPAGQSITYTVKWDRAQTTPKCETPQPNKAKPGTYLLEAKASGFTKTQTSFVLSAD
ncbi:hypothetical protein [Streptomyces sp. NPDC059575]|uniref:hypothetical protein n=1 Tax=Streptomyces sp. NPDC059575 TaxID=3346872 RepID=UPI00369FDCFD